MKLYKSVYFVVGAYLFMFLMDLISTLRIGTTLIEYLEVNPLVSLFGVFWGLLFIILLNFVIIGLWVVVYQKAKNISFRWHVMSMMCTFILFRIFIVFMNWQVGNNPPSVEEAMLVTQEVKNYVLLMNVLNVIIPFVVASLSFFMFKIDHKIEVKQK